MKICAIICEYNPFHNGHKYHIEQAKALSNADYVVCIMSGNFVQRGEAAIMEKHLRAKHALSNGADAVIELPVHFSTSNAELFAKGAIKLINAIPNVTHLCFGSESGTTEEFLSAAKILNNEPIEVSKKIKELSGGQKSKIAFARLLYQKPEIILLDEPTNHMDNITKDYITKYLKSYQGTILIISRQIKIIL